MDGTQDPAVQSMTWRLDGEDAPLLQVEENGFVLRYVVADDGTLIPDPENG